MPTGLCILEEPSRDSSKEFFKKRISEFTTYLEENFGISENFLRNRLDYSDLDETYSELRLYIHSMAYKNNCEIKSNLEELLNEFRIKLDVGKEKRFLIKINYSECIRTFEADTLVEILDGILNYISKEIQDEFVFRLNKWKQIPEDFVLSSSSPFLELYNLVKDNIDFIIERDIAGELYILSYYHDLPILADSEYLDKVVERIKEVNLRIKKGLPGGDYLMSFWDD